MHQVKKIAIVGGESTGKSTLCAHLAAHYNTVWVKEYARKYLEELDRPYRFDDLKKMALGQIATEIELQENANEFLFCDTDLHVFKVWSEFKFQKFDVVIEKLLHEVVYNGYIITSPDFPWQFDPLRENPDPLLRETFFNLYVELIKKKQKPYCIVSGVESSRVSQAINFLHQFEGIA